MHLKSVYAFKAKRFFACINVTVVFALSPWCFVFGLMKRSLKKDEFNTFHSLPVICQNEEKSEGFRTLSENGIYLICQH